MKLRSFKLINSLALLPVTMFVAVLIAYLANEIEFGPELKKFLSPLFILVMIGYYGVPTIGIPYILIWGTTIGTAWKKAELTNKRKVLLSVYSAIATCYLTYIIWWYATSQKASYL